MGLDDREYVRGSGGENFASGPRSMVATIVIVTAGVTVADALFNGALQSYMALSSRLFTRDWNVWTLISYGFIHSPESLGHVFWNMYGLWLFGRSVEEKYGSKEFLRFYLIAVVVAGLGWVIVARLESLAGMRAGDFLIGASGAVTAVGILFAFNFPKAQILLFFILPVPAWLLWAMYVGGDVLMMRDAIRGANADHVAFEAHLIGAAFGAAYFWFGWNFGRLEDFDPRRWLKRKPKLRVHRGPADDDDQFKDKVDRILEKMHREGKDSLSAREQRTLQEASRRFSKDRK